MRAGARRWTQHARFTQVPYCERAGGAGQGHLEREGGAAVSPTHRLVVRIYHVYHKRNVVSHACCLHSLTCVPCACTAVSRPEFLSVPMHVGHCLTEQRLESFNRVAQRVVRTTPSLEGWLVLDDWSHLSSHPAHVSHFLDGTHLRHRENLELWQLLFNLLGAGGEVAAVRP